MTALHDSLNMELERVGPFQNYVVPFCLGLAGGPGEGLEPALGELLRAAAAGDLGPPQSRFLLVARHGLREAGGK